MDTHIGVRFKRKHNKTGLQPVSRPLEQVLYFEGWGVGAKSLDDKTLQTDKHTGLAVVPDADNVTNNSQTLKSLNVFLHTVLQRS